MTDKEKKIAEIRREIELSATYGRYVAVKADDAKWMLDEIECLQQREQTESSTSFWAREGLIEKLQQERDALQREISSHAPEGRNYTNQQYVNLLQERDKVVEALRWYGDKPCIQDQDIGWNVGYIARKRLKELGVSL